MLSAPVTGTAAAALVVAAAVLEGPAMLGAWATQRRYLIWTGYLAVGPGIVGHTGEWMWVTLDPADVLIFLDHSDHS